MDPISAAGIGLAVVPLVIQVFAGCIKGYQLLAEVEGMPAAYQHLRVRLRVEQTRLLNWGEKAGLVEQLFEPSSKILRLDRNVVIDILLEIQSIFRNCVKIMEKYDEKVPLKQGSPMAEPSFDRRFPRGVKSILNKVLSVAEKAPEIPGRLKWAMVRQDTFKSSVEKLIGYNDAIEALLDSNSIDQLQKMQHQTYMVMLQLNGKVEELRQMSLAMQIKTHPAAQRENRLSRASTLVGDQDEGNASFVCLAEFKAHQKSIEEGGSSADLQPISNEHIHILSSHSIRSEALYQSKHVWVEWKTYTIDNYHPPWWNRMIEDRVKQLARLLGSSRKPREFRAPHCLGYIHQTTEEKQMFGFVYERPGAELPSATTTVSLFDLFKSMKMPSLTKRRQLAHSIAQSLMYLHSVNWLHKGIRSNNIVFVKPPAISNDILKEPIVSGFEYARPDITGEWTEPTPRYSEDDVYKHPQTLSGARLRSKKSDDIYSLGVVLVEIAHWRNMIDIFSVPKDTRAARTMVKSIRDRLLESEFSEDIEGKTGELYQEAVRRCLTGGEELGLDKHADETDPEVGAAMYEVFSKEVVGRIGDMRV